MASLHSPDAYGYIFAQAESVMPLTQQHDSHAAAYPYESHASTAPVFVTPREWQQSVASVLNPGNKRRPADNQYMNGAQIQKRMR